jgi:hypothetical protein
MRRGKRKGGGGEETYGVFALGITDAGKHFSFTT